MIEASKERIKDVAKERGYTISESDQQINLHRAQKSVAVQILQHSFLELETLPQLKQIDLLTAAAVFDLLNQSMLNQLVQTLAENQIALLSTINYEGIAFQPTHSSDARYIQFYEDHMVRPQHFGQSLGPKTLDALIQICKDLELEFHVGDSHWQIGNEDQRMHQFLLDYMEEGVGAMLNSETERKDFAQWLGIKQKLLQNKQLTQQIFHRDIFIPALLK